MYSVLEPQEMCLENGLRIGGISLIYHRLQKSQKLSFGKRHPPGYAAHSEMLRDVLFLARQLKDTETTAWSKGAQLMSEFGIVHMVLVL